MSHLGSCRSRWISLSRSPFSNYLCKSKHFPRRYKRKREWVFFFWTQCIITSLFWIFGFTKHRTVILVMSIYNNNNIFLKETSLGFCPNRVMCLVDVFSRSLHVSYMTSNDHLHWWRWLSAGRLHIGVKAESTLGASHFCPKICV